MPAAKKTTAKATAEGASDRAGTELVREVNADEDALQRARLDAALGGNVGGSELIGPAAEHEDHEGGETDSLARRGVRAPLPTAEERAESAEEADEVLVRAPSIRERQTHVPVHLAPTPRAVRQLAAQRRVEDGTPVRVVAESAGFYPGGAGGVRRRPGDVFIYTMSPEEAVLPTWLLAVDGSVPTRRPGEDLKGERIQITSTTTTVTTGGALSGNAGMFGRRAAAAALPSREATSESRPAAKAAGRPTRAVL